MKKAFAKSRTSNTEYKFIGFKKIQRFLARCGQKGFMDKMERR